MCTLRTAPFIAIAIALVAGLVGAADVGAGEHNNGGAPLPSGGVVGVEKVDKVDG